MALPADLDGGDHPSSEGWLRERADLSHQARQPVFSGKRTDLPEPTAVSGIWVRLDPAHEIRGAPIAGSTEPVVCAELTEALLQVTGKVVNAFLKEPGMPQFVGDHGTLHKARASAQQPNLRYSPKLSATRIKGGNLLDQAHERGAALMVVDLHVLGTHKAHWEGLRPPGQALLPKLGLNPA